MFLCDRSPRMMPKVYRFKYPDRRVSYLVLFILCLSVLAIVLPTCYSESLFLSSIFPIVSAGAFLIIIILLASLAIRQRNRLRQQPKGRLRRLSLFLSHPQALKRWPHRVVEHLYRSKGEPSQSKLRRLLNTIPNGANLLANECEPFDVGSPSCSEVAFEPVGLDEPVHKYTSIICLGYEVCDEDMEMYQKPSPDATTGPTDFRVWLYRVQGVVLVALAVLAIALCLGLLGYFTGIYGKWFFVAGVIVYFVTLHPLWIPLIWSKQWWFVPGGMVSRDYFLWKPQRPITIIRAMQAVSFYDMHRKELYIAYDEQVIDMSIEPIQYHAFLVAWFSTARSPSEEEIRSFLDAR